MVQEAFSPKNWGPKDPKKNAEWQAFKDQKKSERRDKNLSKFKYMWHTLIGRT